MRMPLVWTIAAKDLKKFFSDKRILFSAVFLPGFLIFLFYIFSGTAMSTILTGESPQMAACVGLDKAYAIVKSFTEEKQFQIACFDRLEEAMAAVQQGKANLLIAEQDSPFPEEATKWIDIYYNSSVPFSVESSVQLQRLFEIEESKYQELFSVNIRMEQYDLFDAEEYMGKFLRTLLPTMLLTMVCNGCLALVPEAIAGEKERGTLDKLWMSAVSPKEFTFGKLIGMSMIGLLCGMSSFLGVLLSLPQMLKQLPGIHFSISFSAVAALFAVILSTVFLYVALILLVSAFSHSIREAGSYSSVFTVGTVMVGAASLSCSSEIYADWEMLIPIFNSVRFIAGLFANQLHIMRFVLILLTNAIVTFALVFEISQLLQKEPGQKKYRGSGWNFA